MQNKNLKYLFCRQSDCALFYAWISSFEPESEYFCKMQPTNNISAPLLDNLIAKAQYQPDLLNLVAKNNLLKIIDKLQCIAICDNDERRELWLTIERGSIEDFGDYSEYLENGLVENQVDFEKIWKEEYPDPVKCYLLTVSHYNEEYFIFFDDKLTLHLKEVMPEFNESSNYQLIACIDQAVDSCFNWLKKDTAGYNQYVSQHLPFTRRTGRILRKQYWDIDPEEKEWMLKGLTRVDLDTLKTIVKLSENEEQTIFQSKMTSGIFFDCCKMGYEANGYSFDTELMPADLYRKFADGRDFGLGQLDLDSPEAFEEWLDKREWQFGHPWEVCRGGYSTQISLYVDKQADGWRLSLAGKSRGRVVEIVRFAIALYKHNIPFKLWDAKEILAMVSGADYIGIVPEGVMPVYCQSYFPKEDCIIDFMNLLTKKRDEVVKVAYWYQLKEILIDSI